VGAVDGFAVVVALWCVAGLRHAWAYAVHIRRADLGPPNVPHYVFGLWLSLTAWPVPWVCQLFDERGPEPYFGVSVLFGLAVTLYAAAGLVGAFL
jgi:hypothetical protein